jgi:hypothetical protein
MIVHRKAVITIYSLFLILGVFYLYYSGAYGLGGWSDPGPGLLPTIIGSTMVTLSLVPLIALVFTREAAISHEGSPSEEESRGHLASMMRPMGLVAVTAAYFLVLSWLGYYASTVVYIVTVMRLAGAGGVVKPVVFSASVTLITKLLFVDVLGLQVPGL